MTRPVSRRAMLGAIVAGSIGLPLAGLAGWGWASGGTVQRPVAFSRPLPIPPLAAGPPSDGRRPYALELAAASADLGASAPTPVWGVDGAHLGPTVRVERGETVAMTVRNALPEATTLHWHGAKLPAAADGGPHHLIDPGSVWSPEWVVDQPAATLWYHPHPHGATRHHVYRGIAGLLLVDDPATPDGLPGEYGVDDVPVMIQDVEIAPDGTFDERGIDFGGTDLVGLLGSTILVNGAPGPVFRATTRLLRLRVLNASNARVYDLAFGDARRFHVVGVDAGLLEAPVEVEHVMVSPGERVELLVRLEPGDEVMLRSRPPLLGANPLYERFAGGDDVFDLLLIRADAALEDRGEVPTRLPGAAEVPLPDDARIRRFELQDFRIDDRVMDHDRIDFVVELDGEREPAERWILRNVELIPHNFHVHNAEFRVRRGNDATAGAWTTGPKDTVYVAPGAELELEVRFGAHADSRTPFMFHCHLLAHEDAGMMGQFLIAPPGTEPHALESSDAGTDTEADADHSQH